MVCTLVHKPSLERLNLYSSSGMTETSTSVAMFPLSQKVGTLGSVGQLIAGVRARVVKEDGTLAKSGESGELVVKIPSAALRYRNNEKA
jgi:acyl-CoA synthetase (AMP-forming)/AMP-acid ligase II